MYLQIDHKAETRSVINYSQESAGDFAFVAAGFSLCLGRLPL